MTQARRSVGGGFSISLALAGILLLGAGLSGCTTTSSSPGSSTVVDPLVPDTEAFLVAMPKHHGIVLSASKTNGLESLPWVFMGLSKDGRVLDVAYLVGSPGVKPTRDLSLLRTVGRSSSSQ
jgi:hypothetical protein